MKRISNLQPIYDDSDMAAVFVVGLALGTVAGGVAAAALGIVTGGVAAAALFIVFIGVAAAALFIWPF